MYQDNIYPAGSQCVSGSGVKWYFQMAWNVCVAHIKFYSQLNYPIPPLPGIYIAYNLIMRQAWILQGGINGMYIALQTRCHLAWHECCLCVCWGWNGNWFYLKLYPLNSIFYLLLSKLLYINKDNVLSINERSEWHSNRLLVSHWYEFLFFLLP